MNLQQLEKQASALAIGNKLSREVFNVSESREGNETVTRIGVKVSDNDRVESDYFFIRGDQFNAPAWAKAFATYKFLNKDIIVEVEKPKNEPKKEEVKDEESKEDGDDSKKSKKKTSKKTTKKKESSKKAESGKKDSKESKARAPRKKVVKYNNLNKDHTSVLASFLNKEYGDAWKKKEGIKEFSLSLVDEDFREDNGELCESFVKKVTDFFNDL